MVCDRGGGGACSSPWFDLSTHQHLSCWRTSQTDATTVCPYKKKTMTVCETSARRRRELWDVCSFMETLLLPLVDHGGNVLDSLGNDEHPGFGLVSFCLSASWSSTAKETARLLFFPRPVCVPPRPAQFLPPAGETMGAEECR